MIDWGGYMPPDTGEFKTIGQKEYLTNGCLTNWQRGTTKTISDTDGVDIMWLADGWGVTGAMYVGGDVTVSRQPRANYNPYMTIGLTAPTAAEHSIYTWFPVTMHELQHLAGVGGTLGFIFEPDSDVTVHCQVLVCLRTQDQVIDEETGEVTGYVMAETETSVLVTEAQQVAAGNQDRLFFQAKSEDFDMSELDLTKWTGVDTDLLYVKIRIGYYDESGTLQAGNYRIEQMSLRDGLVNYPFIPLDKAENEKRCFERYYRPSYPIGIKVVGRALSSGSTAASTDGTTEATSGSVSVVVDTPYKMINTYAGIQFTANKPESLAFSYTTNRGDITLSDDGDRFRIVVINGAKAYISGILLTTTRDNVQRGHVYNLVMENDEDNWWSIDSEPFGAKD